MNTGRCVLPLGAIVLFLAAGCSIRVSIDGNGERITGSGSTSNETREVFDFERVELAGEGRVIISPGTDEALTVEAEDNLLPYLESEVDGVTLKLSTRKGIDVDPTLDIVYRIGVPELTAVILTGAGSFEVASWEAQRIEVKLSGAGDVEVTDLRAADLDVEIDGVGRVQLAGSVDEQRVTLSGVGTYEARDLASRIADVRSSGTGNATVWVTDSLTARLSGVGNLSYFGSPSISQEVSGLGNVEPLGAR